MERHAGLPKGLQRIQITAYVHKATNHACDAHSLTPAGKAIVDWLVGYGLIPNDNNAHLLGLDIRAGEKGKPSITLELRALRGAVEAVPEAVCPTPAFNSLTKTVQPTAGR